MASTHRVFVSYHHSNDQAYRRIFELRFSRASKSLIFGGVQPGDIREGVTDQTIKATIRDKYLRNTTVTVVLVGTETWKRKHVDWEIASSLRNTELNPRSGLMGLLLRSHSDFGKEHYTPGSVPPRLHDNVKCGYASLHHWTEDAEQIREWIHKAYLRRRSTDPDQSRPLFRRNKSGNSWA